MHIQQMAFFKSVRDRYPDYFNKASVLDVGSLDRNGCNKPLFTGCQYYGMDIGPGKNVNIIAPVHLSGFPAGYFDTIISGECFEHDLHFIDSIKEIVRILRPGGLFAMTCATGRRAEHGTKRRGPNNSPLTVIIEAWQDFYQNRTAEDFEEIPEFSQMEGVFSVERGNKDLYYYGIKK